MKNGVLVLAHRDAEHCLRLVRRMAPVVEGIWIHVDAKADIADFAQIEEQFPTKVFFPAVRHSINWGGFNMVQATLSSLQQMRGAGYDRYSLISGDTYPIRGNDYIRNYLSQEKDYISDLSAPPPAQKMNRIHRVYVPDTEVGSLKPDSHWRHTTPEDLEHFATLPEVFETRKQFLEKIKYRAGSQWWSLRRSSLDAVFDFIHANPDFIQHLRYSAVPDEAFFQTAFATIGLPFEPEARTPVYDVWHLNPQPFVFTEAEHLGLLNSPHQPFARKFSSKSNALLDLLDARD